MKHRIGDRVYIPGAPETQGTIIALDGRRDDLVRIQWDNGYVSAYESWEFLNVAVA